MCIEKQGKCQNLVEQQGSVVRDLCVTVDPDMNLLQVTATALDSCYALVRTQVRIGTSAGGIDGNISSTSEGAPDTVQFPDFACNSQGLSKVGWGLSLAEQFSAEASNVLPLTVVAHAVVANLDENGVAILESKADAFAAQTAVESPVWYGYMSVPCSTVFDKPDRKAMLRGCRK
jgi:hypothetical protein